MQENNSVTSRNILSRAIHSGSRFIDYRMAIGGCIVMGGIVFAVNYYGTNNFYGASTASLKQGGYTFLFGGFIMKGCEHLATRIHRNTLALLAAILIPSAVAISLTFGVHSLKGTPKPIASTIPTAMLVIPSTVIWGMRKRKSYYSEKVKENFKIISTNQSVKQFCYSFETSLKKQIK